MTKPRKPASFRLEEIEVVETPLGPLAIATDAAQLPATVRALPALERGWRSAVSSGSRRWSGCTISCAT